jgi:predicted acylesterase/phospholipase RssA
MPKPYRVLSIDGGGIRGIIPATFLAEVERRTGQPIASLFDLIVGTSTGGILALGLTVPDGAGRRPRNTAASLRELYTSQAETIFPGGGKPNWTQRLWGTRDPKEWLKNPGKILMGSAQQAGAPFGGNPAFAGGARYFPSGLEEVLGAQLSGTLLSSAVTRILVTSYDMAYGEPLLFSSQPLEGTITDVPMAVVARATSAGPTYFEPQLLKEGGRLRVLVDGGVYINNPSMLAFAMAPANRPLVLVSLGTGQRNPAAPRSYEQIKSANWLSTVRQVMEASMTGGGEIADAVLTTLKKTEGRPQQYWRIQTTVGRCNFAMDDSSPLNTACLAALAETLVRERDADLTAIAAALRSD